MVDQYAHNPNVVFVAVEWDDTVGAVKAWIEDYGWTFHVARNGPLSPVQSQTVYEAYRTVFDTFYVIDGTGTITYRDDPHNDTTDFARWKTEIESALGTVPVNTLTWGRLKKLY